VGNLTIFCFWNRQTVLVPKSLGEGPAGTGPGLRRLGRNTYITCRLPLATSKLCLFDT
jgi:hypothetical protein